MTKQRLELTWIGKETQHRLEPRILVENRSLSYRAGPRLSGRDDCNLLIQGDNLLALKALAQDFSGRIKCSFIDPPYNTGSAFEHYDDGIEHSIWLSMMRDRVTLIRDLLSTDGSLWISLDDNEMHYCKVLCDEIFGRKNFVSTLAWQKSFAKKNKALISGSHDHILVYAKEIGSWKRNLLSRDEQGPSPFKNLDSDARGRWQSVSYSVPSEDADRRKAYRYPIILPSGRAVLPPAGRHWNGLPIRTDQLIADGRLWFGKDGDSTPRMKVFLSEVQDGIVPDTWWTHEQVGSTQDSKREMLQLFDGTEPFATPKPEKLLYRIINIASNEGDIILDSFAGSGTTGAVAHKMGRRWIMVELGEHASSHIAPRLKKVIDGQDPGGVTGVTAWQGGGAFRFMHLAPSLLQQDRFGQWVISSEYQPEMLVEAVCRLMGFTYAPSRDSSTYWQHGYSTETDFIFVTTQPMTQDALAKLSYEVGEGRTLLVACRAFTARADAFPNLTMKKIPHAVLTRCEWGRDDYSLTVSNAHLPEGDSGEVEAAEAEPAPAKARRGRPRAAKAERPSLFDEEA